VRLAGVEDRFKVEEEVVKTVAGNESNSKEVMALHFD
jgi:hypothetical protein